jgi:DNA-binding response OmpR family regulator
MIMHEQTHMDTKRVIVVDHDQATSELIAELLRSEGLAPLSYPTWLLSVACIERAQADLLILDLGMSDPSLSLELLGDLRRNVPTRVLPVIVNSTDDRMLARIAEPLRDLGCITLAKPFDLDEFSALIGACLRTWPGQIQASAC